MKKIILLISVALIALASCKKNALESQEQTGKVNLVSQSSSGYSVTEDGYLHFASPEDYNAVLAELNLLTERELDDWEETIRFTSSYTHYGIADIDDDDSVAVYSLSDNFKNKGFVDPFLLRIIDKDGLMRIGDYLFKFMIDEGYILQMYAKDMRIAYADFKAGIFNSRHMNRLENAHIDSLSNDGDIFDLLGNGVTGLQPMSFAVRDLFGNKDVSWIPGPVGSTPGELNPYKHKLVGVYQNAIVYRAFRAKFKYYSQGLGNIEIPNATIINIVYNNSTATYKMGNNTVETKTPTTSQVVFSNNTRDNLTWLIYGGAFYRRLKEGSFDVEWNYKEKYTQTMRSTGHLYSF